MTGPLVDACEQTGEVSWQDKGGETRKVTLGQHAIRLVPRPSYRR
jgi:hypothetical protein